MKNPWISEPEPGTADVFLELYDAFFEGRTSNIGKLQIKLRNLWYNFSLEEKKEFAQELIRTKRVPESLANLIEKFNGSFYQIV